MTSDTKKSFDVVAAIIEDHGHIFAAQRDYGELKGKWEFPGGKIEVGETPEEALIREIKEELDTEITVDKFFTHIDYEYPSFFLHMDVFICHVKSGYLQTNKGIHSEETFVPLGSLMELDWCPADRIVAGRLLEANKQN